MHRIVGIIVGCLAGVALGRVFIDGLINSTNDGEGHMFLLLAIFSFVPAGLIGGVASLAVAKEEISFSEHMYFPMCFSLFANFTTCAVGSSNAF